MPSLIEMSEISAQSYARIHGYTYRRVYYDFAETIGFVSCPTWVKVHALWDIMKVDNFQHEWIVFMDLDVLFRDYKTSLEEKMKEWNGGEISPKVKIFMANDPAGNPANYQALANGTKVLNTNQGFQIWRNTPENIKLLKEFVDCRKTYCSEFDNKVFCEQSTFTKYFRFNLPEGALQIIPCDQANGFPPYFENEWEGVDSHNQGCSGSFVSHFWCESRHRLPARTKIYELLISAIYEGEKAFRESYRRIAKNGTISSV